MAHDEARRVPLRRQILEDRWKAILDAAARSGLTHSEFCRRRGISQCRYFWWKRRLAWPPLRDRLSSASFLPVRLVTSRRAPAVDPRPHEVSSPLEVILERGRRVVVHPGFDPATLRRLVDALESDRC